MSTGRAVRQERHVLRRQDLGDDALVAVAAGHLVADADLALLGDRHPDQAVDARLEVVVELAPELADLDDLAALAVGQAQASSPSPRGPSRRRSPGGGAPPRSARSRPSGVILPTRMSPGRTSAPM